MSGEFVKLADISSLVDLVFVGNPLEEKYSAEGTWIDEATKRVPNLKKLDGKEDVIFSKLLHTWLYTDTSTAVYINTYSHADSH